jgi:hypothetical protein
MIMSILKLISFFTVLQFTTYFAFRAAARFAPGVRIKTLSWIVLIVTAIPYIVL